MNRYDTDWRPALLLMAALCAGCAAPRATTTLGHVLQREIGRTDEEFSGVRCTVGAHRGQSVDYTENTLAALRAADANPRYEFIEFDVQYSKDGKIVVFHDKRLTRVFGSLRSVGRATYAELSELTGGEIAGYHEVMDSLKEKKLNIEIKSQGEEAEDERLVDEIVADVRRRARERDVLLSSISADVIRYISSNYPEIPTGRIFWLTSSTYVHLDALTERLYRELSETRADYLMLHVANLRNVEDLLRFKPRGKTIVFWDFDDAMYVIHRELSDRLWGRSAIATFFDGVAFRVSRPFRRGDSNRDEPEREIDRTRVNPLHRLVE